MDKRIKKSWNSILPYLTLAFVITLMLSYQLNARATFISSDAWIHFYRFFDTKMQIKTGNFSYFQTNYGFNHSGRIFNAMYGPLFAYLNGLLLLLCKSWFIYEIIIEYAVFMTAGIGLYKLCQKVKISQAISLVLAIIYLQFGIVISIYRFNWMAWGAALAPYVLIQAVNMVEDQKRPIHWLSLALIMSLLAQIHVLSTVILTLTLIPFFLYGLLQNKNKKIYLLDTLKALFLAFLLTANIWGTFLLLYPHNHIALPNNSDLNQYAMHLSKFKGLHAHVSYTIATLILVQLIYVLLHFKQSKINTISTMVAIVIFLVASRWFPWIKIQALYPKVGSFFQFPYRLMLGAYPLLLMGSGISITELVRNKGSVVKNYAIFALLIVLLQNFSFNVIANYNQTKYFLTSNKVVLMSNTYFVAKKPKKIKYITRHTTSGKLFSLAKHVEPDYLPCKKHASNLVYAHMVVDQQHHYIYKVQGNRLILNWESKKSGNKYLPIVMYDRSILMVNGKNQTKSHKNTIMQPLVKVQKGKNQATLQFMTPIWFKILLGITVVSWIIVIIYPLSRRIKGLK